MAKRSGSDVFSPELRETTRKRLNSSMMEEEGQTPALAILDTSKSIFDIEGLKAKFPNVPDLTHELVLYIANEVIKSIKDDINVTMNQNHQSQNERCYNMKTTVENSLEKLVKEIEDMEKQLADVKCENKQLKQKLIDQEVYSRRSNLVINGIPEHPNQNLLKVFYSIAKHELNVEREPMIDRIHRKGPPPKSNNQRPRPIVVRFTNYQDRMMIWHNRKRRDPQNSDARYQNRAPKFSIVEDFPPEVLEIRKRLFPIANEANETHNMHAIVKVDKLILDGKVYDVDSLHTLPTCLLPISQSYRETDKQIAFFRKYCPLSNHSPAPFQINENKYNCTEQMFLSEKCYSYGHKKAGDTIRRMTDPGMMVQEAKVCQGYNEKWEEDMYNIMLTANLAKYTQNDNHRDFLMSTGTKRLVEGSPYDTVWGVGMAFSDPRVDDKNNWRGDNLLGDVLMQTRRLLLPRSPIPRKPKTPAGASGTVLTPTTIESAAAEDDTMDIQPTQAFTPGVEVQENISH